MDFPQLEHLKSLPSQYSTYDFSNTALLAVQHLMGTNGSLFELLNQMGLPYEQMFLLGKVYSTSGAVYDELKHRGAYIHPASVSLGEVQLRTDYKLSLARAADEMLTNALVELSPSKTLLLVDDGGVLISIVNDRVSEINARIVAVEQTRSGAETLRALPDIQFPVVNVAESEAKLQHESPYIATSIIEHIVTRIGRLLNHKPLTESNVLIVGHGAVGRNVAVQLRQLVRKIEVHDIVDLQEVAVTRNFEQAVRHKDIVIGCVGKSWLPNNPQSLLPGGIVLASGSSSNSEFIGLSLNPTNCITPASPFKNVDLVRAHSDYSFNSGKGWILNAGFPVNFDGSADPIAAEIVELTRMLMLSGILQALTTEAEPGLQELKVRFQPPKISRISSMSKLRSFSSKV